MTFKTFVTFKATYALKKVGKMTFVRYTFKIYYGSQFFLLLNITNVQIIFWKCDNESNEKA